MMDLLALILMICGMIITLIGAIWVIVIAFQEDFPTGLACIFIPFYTFLYTIKHYRTKTGKPLLVELLGSVLVGVGVELFL